MSTKYEYYDENDDNYQMQTTTVWHFMQFTPSTTHVLTHVVLKLYRSAGVSPGTIPVEVWTLDGSGYPTVSKIAEGSTDGDTLPEDPSTEWRQVDLTGSPTVNAGTKYAILVKGSSTGGRWRIDATSPAYAGGQEGRTLDGGSSWQLQTFDCMFEEWGDPPNGNGGGEETKVAEIDKAPYNSIYKVEKADIQKIKKIDGASIY